MSGDRGVDCSIVDDAIGCSCSGCFLRRFFFGMTGIDEGGSGMFVERGQDVVLPMDDEDEDEGETGEPPALLPFSHFEFAGTRVDDGRRTSPGRLEDEPVDKAELLGEMTFGRMGAGSCL